MRIMGVPLVALLLVCATVAAEKPPSSRVQGVSYRHDEIPAGPWSVHIVKIDRSNTNLQLQTTLPPGGRFGLALLSSQVKALRAQHANVLAAINGDYYERHRPYVGDPQGLQIWRGELVSAPFDWTCFWIDPAGNPNMGKVEDRFRATLPNGSLISFGLNQARDDDDAVLFTSAVGSKTHTRGGTELNLEPLTIGPQLPLRAGERFFSRVVDINNDGESSTATNRLILSIGPKLLKKICPPEKGDVIRISTATIPSLKNVQTAIGGGPALLRDGKSVFPRQTRIRHPRSVVGWNNRFIFLVEVDGRQRELSVGMTFEELSQYLLKIDCQNAMCLDGGGSSTLWALGQVMNNPSEGSERGSANGLVVLAKESH